jgi:hypothetical protein
MIATVLRCLASYIIACMAASVVAVSFVLPPHELAGQGLDRLAAAGIWLLLATLHTAIFAAPFAAVALAVAEWRCLTSPIYYAAAGFGIAMLGLLAQISGAGFPLIVTLYVLAALSASGVVGGAVYWMLAGRRAGRQG